MCFSIPSITQNTSAATTATCRPGLMTRARQIRRSPDRRRQQIQFVFRRQRRLAARCRRSDRGRVVDQEGGDAAMEQAVLLQQLRPTVDRERAGPRASSDSSAPIWVMKPCRPTLSRIRVRDRREVRIGLIAIIRLLPVCSVSASRARPPREWRRRSGCRPDLSDRRGRGPTARRGRRSAPAR